MNRLSIFGVCMALMLVLACGAKEEVVEDAGQPVSEGERLIESGAFEEAQAYYEGEIAAAPEDAEKHFLAGQAAAMAANYDQAVAHITKAMELQPETAGHYDWLGRIYGAQARIGNLGVRMKLAPEIKKNFEKAAELDPDNSETQFFLGMFYLVAPERMGGSREKGTSIAEELLESNPVQGHQLMAQLHIAQREGEAAEAQYKEVIALEPENPQSYSDLGTLYVGLEKFDLAIENFNKALEIDPNHQVSLFGLGRVGEKSPEHTDRGLEALDKLATLKPDIQSPNMGEAHYYRGAIYERQGDNVKALAAYEASVGAGNIFAQKNVDAMKAAIEAAETATAVTEEAPTTDTQEVEATEAEPATDETTEDEMNADSESSDAEEAMPEG